MTSWIEVHVMTSAAHAETLSNQLSLLGADAVTLLDAGDQPIFEPTPATPRVWDETIVVGLFTAQTAMPPIFAYLADQEKQGILTQFKAVHVADEDWVRRSLDQFKPMPFGQKLWICPSWHVAPHPNAVNIILDPGLAFGTGSHATTALCLEWLDANIQDQDLIIDYGCGSGILGIAARKLGAKKVLAVDHDHQALIATQQNAQQNEIAAAELQTFFPDEMPNVQADILIANILAKPLVELSEKLAKMVKFDGKILLSGILKEQIPQIIEAYAPFFAMQPPVFKEDWVALTGIRIFL